MRGKKAQGAFLRKQDESSEQDSTQASITEISHVNQDNEINNENEIVIPTDKAPFNPDSIFGQKVTEISATEQSSDIKADKDDKHDTLSQQRENGPSYPSVTQGDKMESDVSSLMDPSKKDLVTESCELHHINAEQDGGLQDFNLNCNDPTGQNILSRSDENIEKIVSSNISKIKKDMLGISKLIKLYQVKSYENYEVYNTMDNVKSSTNKIVEDYHKVCKTAMHLKQTCDKLKAQYDILYEKSMSVFGDDDPTKQIENLNIKISSLESIKDQLEAEANQLRKHQIQNEILEKDVQRCKKDIAHKEEKITRLLEQVNKKNELLKEKEHEIKAEKKNVAKLLSVEEKLKTVELELQNNLQKNKELQGQLENSKMMKEEIESQKSFIDGDLAILDEFLNLVNGETPIQEFPKISQLCHPNNTIRSAIETILDLNNQIKVLNSNYENEVIRLGSESDKLLAKLKVKDDKISELNKVKIKDSEFTNLKFKYDELFKKADLLTLEKHKLETQLQQDKNKESNQDELNRLKEEVKILKDENSSLKASQDKSDNKVQGTADSNSIVSLEKENKELKVKLNFIDSEWRTADGDRIKNKFQELMETVLKLEDQEFSLNEENFSTLTSFQKTLYLKARLGKAQKENDEIKATIKKLNETISQQNKEIPDSGNNTNITNSNSPDLFECTTLEAANKRIAKLKANKHEFIRRINDMNQVKAALEDKIKEKSKYILELTAGLDKGKQFYMQLQEKNKAYELVTEQLKESQENCNQLNAKVSKYELVKKQLENELKVRVNSNGLQPVSQINTIQSANSLASKRLASSNSENVSVQDQLTSDESLKLKRDNQIIFTKYNKLKLKYINELNILKNNNVMLKSQKAVLQETLTEKLIQIEKLKAQSTQNKQDIEIASSPLDLNLEYSELGDISLSPHQVTLGDIAVLTEYVNSPIHPTSKEDHVNLVEHTNPFIRNDIVDENINLSEYEVPVENAITLTAQQDIKTGSSTLHQKRELESSSQAEIKKVKVHENILTLLENIIEEGEVAPLDKKPLDIFPVDATLDFGTNFRVFLNSKPSSQNFEIFQIDGFYNSFSETAELDLSTTMIGCIFAISVKNAKQHTCQFSIQKRWIPLNMNISNYEQNLIIFLILWTLKKRSSTLLNTFLNEVHNKIIEFIGVNVPKNRANSFYALLGIYLIFTKLFQQSERVQVLLLDILTANSDVKKLKAIIHKINSISNEPFLFKKEYDITQLSPTSNLMVIALYHSILKVFELFGNKSRKSPEEYKKFLLVNRWPEHIININFNQVIQNYFLPLCSDVKFQKQYGEVTLGRCIMLLDQVSKLQV